MNERVNPFVSKGMNQNLIDNWYFIGGGSQLGDGHLPINQKGKTEYALNGYTIDRWKTVNSNVVVTLDSDCMILKNKLDITLEFNQYIYLDQIVGEQVTLSSIVNGVLQSRTARIPTEFTTPKTVVAAINDTSAGWNDVLCLQVGGRWVLAVRFCIRPNQEMRIKAVKLEKGTAQTLAHFEGETIVINDVANYEEEFLKCSRYMVNLKTPGSRYTTVGWGTGCWDGKRVGLSVIMPVPLAKVPTLITNDGEYRITSDGNYGHGNKVTSITIDVVVCNTVYIYATSDSVEIGKSYLLTGSNTDFILDANI